LTAAGDAEALSPGELECPAVVAFLVGRDEVRDDRPITVDSGASVNTIVSARARRPTTAPSKYPLSI
jgi:hypothetical protein